MTMQAEHGIIFYCPDLLGVSQRAKQCVECREAMSELKTFFNNWNNKITMQTHFVKTCQLIFHDCHQKNYHHRLNYLMRLVSQSCFISNFIFKSFVLH